MIRVVETKDAIVLSGGRFPKWPGAFLAGAGFGAFVTFWCVIFLRSFVWVWTIFPPVFFLFFLIYLWLNPTIDVRIDKAARTISVRRRSLLKYDFEVYSFSELDGPVYVREIDMEWQKNPHRLMMKLKDGRRIALSEKGRQADRYYEAAQRVNDGLSMADFGFRISDLLGGPGRKVIK
ncbi:MAG: hypothetical protein JSS81_17580 [Acidobacteria bacterium]|nr:hypothetical protein [Acidobacteriota bacterium]